jgi:hypothetical protein
MATSRRRDIDVKRTFMKTCIRTHRSGRPGPRTGSKSGASWPRLFAKKPFSGIAELLIALFGLFSSFFFCIPEPRAKTKNGSICRKDSRGHSAA